MRTWRAKRGVALGSLALAMSAAAITMGSTAAGAATAGGPIMPATAQPTTQTMSVGYSCAMSAYGGTSPVPMTAVISAPTLLTARESANITFSTDKIALPTSVSSSTAMQAVTGVSFSAAAVVNDAGTNVSATLKSFTAPAILDKPTAIPNTLPIGTNVPLGHGGTAVIAAPATVVITPSDVSGKSLTAIQCSLAAAKSLTVTVSTPPPPPPPGPVYTCSFMVAGQKLVTTTAPIPMSLSASGARTTGSTVAITLSSPSSGLGGPYTGGLTGVGFSGSLPVSGAQQGGVSLYRRTTDLTSTTFAVTGHLFLTNPGTDSVRLPRSFIFYLFKNNVTGLLSCTSKGTPEVGLALKVTGAAVTPPTALGSATPVPSAAGTGTPVGAPNTGGGHSASSMPLIAGGAALLALGGAALTIAARKRRHGQSPIA